MMNMVKKEKEKNSLIQSMNTNRDQMIEFNKKLDNMRVQYSQDLDHQKSQNEIMKNKLFEYSQNKKIMGISYSLIQDKFE